MTHILNCNQRNVYNIIKAGVPQTLLPFLSENWETILPEFEKNNFSISAFLQDRTGGIEHYLNVDKMAHPIPSAGDFNLSLYEIIEARAKELLSYGEPINVSWSGGIDSTFILFCLHHYATDKDQVRVYGTYNSVIESGALFDRHIKDKIKFNIFTNRDAGRTYLDQDGIFVTGAGGNQLFYTDLQYLPLRDSIFKYRTSENIEDFIKKNIETPYEDCLEDSSLEFHNRAIKRSERPIKTLQDLRWFNLFNYKWYACINDSYRLMEIEPAKKVYSFYNTEDFQKWAITNKDKPTLTGDYTDERWQLRNLITEYTGDSTFSTTKKNTTSTVSKNTQEWLFTLNDYSQVLIT